MGNEGNIVMMVAYGKCKCGLTPARFKTLVNFVIAKFLLASCIKRAVMLFSLSVFMLTTPAALSADANWGCCLDLENTLKCNIVTG